MGIAMIDDGDTGTTNTYLGLNRRRFIQGATLGLSAVGATLLTGCRGRRAASAPAGAEPPPETMTIRLSESNTLCFAPQYLASELLRSEGFTAVEYVKGTAERPPPQLLASGAVDLGMGLAPRLVIRVDAGDPIVVLGGVHSGCYELFGTDRVRTIKDLKGKSIAVDPTGTHRQFVSTMAAYVGLDPDTDIRWVAPPPAEAMELLRAGEIDAFIGFPPDNQELRARKIGHVVVNTATDKPWSQYFCCMLAGNKDFVRRHPVATKRAMRAILKATAVCNAEPERAAQFVVDRGYTPSYDYAIQAMREIPFSRWREFDPEDTLRFYALRLREAGMIKSSPKKIIGEATDWRLFNELKKELKA
jgi:NitT/TauT family transport system substrate-binding protein